MIDDLNFYANKEEVRRLEEVGGKVVRHNRMRKFYLHLLNFRVSTFFQRNHQKVMLVDDNIFCGSLNISNDYSRVRYGHASFRDLNVILTRQPSKKVRDFFRNMLVLNVKFYPDYLKESEINAVFDELDERYQRLYG